MDRRLLAAIVLGVLLIGTLWWAVQQPTPITAPPPDEPAEPAATDTGRARPRARGGERTDETPAAAEPVADAEPGRIEGSVARGGQVVEGVRIFLLRGSGDDNLPLGDTTTDDTGSFTFEEVPAGPYRLVAREPSDPATDLNRANVIVHEGAIAEIAIKLLAVTRGGVVVRGSVHYAGVPDVPKRFSFSLWGDGDDREPIPVTGKDGRFEVRVPRPGEYTVMDVRADGEVHKHFWHEIVVKEGDEVSIPLHAAFETTLVVMDEATGQPVQAALAYRAVHERDFAFHFDAGHQLPGPATLAGTALVADGAGRIELGRDRGLTDWYVVAEGYAWAAVRVLFGPDDATAVLRPGGSLRLRIERWTELGGAKISARVGEGRPVSIPPPGRSGEVVVLGMLPGEHEVTVRRGNWFERGHVYGTGTVEIVAGAMAELTIAADPGEVKPKVSVSGTVVVHPAWEKGPGWITFEGADPGTADVRETFHFRSGSADDGWAFEIPPLPSGRYDVEIDPIQWRQQVEVSPTNARFRFEVGEPGKVRVRVVDAVTGAEIEGAEVSWFALLPGQSSWSSERAKLDESTNRFVIVAPEGELRVSAEAPGYIDNAPFEGETVKVEPGGTHDFTVQLQPGGNVKVLIRLDGKPFVAEEPMVSLSPKETTEAGWSSMSTSSRGGAATVDGLQPGLYEVKLEGELTGYEKPAAVEVIIEAGKTAEVVFELRRSR